VEGPTLTVKCLSFGACFSPPFPAPPYSAAANCPPGKKVFGGGESAQIRANWPLIESRPNSTGTGWIVEYDLPGLSYNNLYGFLPISLKAWAICANVQ
jgi:hypothetical protein